MQRGATAKPIPIGQPEPLIAADLERLKENRSAPTTVKKLRDSHHMVARLTAAGLRPGEVAEACGYTRERVTALLKSPAIQELVAKYRSKVDVKYEERIDAFLAYRTKNMVAMERHISDHIDEADESGELIPIRTALAYSADSADRFGYGKKTQQTNINVDFAANLERTLARSKGAIIEGQASSSDPLPSNSPPLPRSGKQEPNPPVASPPLLRRMA